MRTEITIDSSLEHSDTKLIMIRDVECGDLEICLKIQSEGNGNAIFVLKEELIHALSLFK